MLLKLLEHLIDSNHEVFRGKGSPLELKSRMQAMVQSEYPETEAGTPEDKRLGAVPESLLLAMRQSQKNNSEMTKSKELPGARS